MENLDQTGQLDFKYDIGFDEDGIFCAIYVGEQEIIHVHKSWDDIISDEIKMQCVPDGPIAVQQEFDGVEHLNNLVDTLSAVSDNFNEKVRERNIILLHKLIEGITVDEATVTFNQYMKGDYD